MCETKQDENIKAVFMRNILGTAFFILIILWVSSCSNAKFVSIFPGTSHLSIRMTDSTANIGAFMIDLQGVAVADSDSLHEVMLNVNNGIYNVLNFSGGIDTMIASGDIKSGLVTRIKLILGSNNTVTVDSVVYPLVLIANAQSGINLNIHQVFQPSESYTIFLDFDVNQSVIAQGNGLYQLNPVIRIVDATVTGSIKGKISPIGTRATVFAAYNGVTYSTAVNVNGDFLLTSLPPGAYDVTIIPALPLQPVTLTGKFVTVGVTTNIGTIVLKI